MGWPACLRTELFPAEGVCDEPAPLRDTPPEGDVTNITTSKDTVPIHRIDRFCKTTVVEQGRLGDRDEGSGALRLDGDKAEYSTASLSTEYYGGAGKYRTGVFQRRHHRCSIVAIGSQDDPQRSYSANRRLQVQVQV